MDVFQMDPKQTVESWDDGFTTVVKYEVQKQGFSKSEILKQSTRIAGFLFLHVAAYLNSATL